MTEEDIRTALATEIAVDDFDDEVVVLERDDSGRPVMTVKVSVMASMMADVPLTKTGLESFGGGYERQAARWYERGLILE